MDDLQKQKLVSTSNSFMFKVYLDLYEKGFYIMPGGKFGADLILYEGDISIYYF